MRTSSLRHSSVSSEKDFVIQGCNLSTEPAGEKRRERKDAIPRLFPWLGEVPQNVFPPLLPPKFHLWHYLHPQFHWLEGKEIAVR
jgi:hypothetical protein